MTVETRVVLARQRQLGQLELGQVAASSARESRGAVLFGTTGSEDPTVYLGYFTFGRPPNLLDRYLGLRIRSLDVVDDDTCIPVVSFLAGGGPRNRDLALLRSASRRAGARPARAHGGAGGRGRPDLDRDHGALGAACSRRAGSSSSGSPCAGAGSSSSPETRALPTCRRRCNGPADHPAACKGHGFLDDPGHLPELAGEPHLSRRRSAAPT